MRTILIILFNCLLGFAVAAQSPDSVVEVRLQLLQQTDGKAVKGLSVSVTIINHSNEDIYIPRFELFSSYAGIHYYEGTDEKWREIDIATQDYYKPFPPAKKENGMTRHNDPPLFFV